MRRDERGSAGVLMTAAMTGAAATVFAVGAVFISWFGLIREAEQTAELAALAGASAAVAGGDACSAAITTAERNGAEVHACEVRGEGMHVVVEVTVAALLEPSPPGAVRVSLRSATAGTASGG